MFVTLWSVAGLVYFRNNRNAAVRWMGGTLFVGGCSSFAFSIHATILPYLRDADLLTPRLQRALEITSIPAFLLYWYGLGYCMLVCALYFARTGRRHNGVLAAVLAVPPVYVLISTGDASVPFRIEMTDVRLVNGLYIAAAVLLFAAGSWLERDRQRRRNAFRTTFVLSVAAAWAYVNDFLGVTSLAFGSGRFEVVSNGLWKYNSLIIVWIVGFTLYYGARYGFLGFRLRIEKQRYDDSIRHMTQGTQILNHSIKNELLKINYLTERALSLLGDGDRRAEAPLRSIIQVTGHLTEMVGRIKDKADDLVLRESEEWLSELVESTLDAVRPLYPGKLDIVREYRVDGLLQCDTTHVREVLGNVMINALDAMAEDGGRIHILARLSKRRLLLSIRDNGEGISKENVARVFAPFFSTKKNTQSYGLGLSYCVSVMHKHGGRISVEYSEPGQGTSMLLEFPRKRFDMKKEKPSSPFVVH